MIIHKKGFYQSKLILVALLLSQSIAKLNLKVEDFEKCIQNSCRSDIKLENEYKQYNDCFQNDCQQINPENLETKQIYANLLTQCLDQCVPFKIPEFQRCGDHCILQNIDDSSEDSPQFQLNTFIIAISVILGIIIIFIIIIKWAYMKKNKKNLKKPSGKISPKLVPSLPTNILPTMELNEFVYDSQKPIQGIPCNENNIESLAIFKAIPDIKPMSISKTFTDIRSSNICFQPLSGKYKNKASIILFDEEIAKKQNNLYFPGKSMDVITSSITCEKKQDTPTLLITQININDELNENKKIPDNFSSDKMTISSKLELKTKTDIQSKIELYSKNDLQSKMELYDNNLSPFTPTNFKFNPYNKLNIPIEKLNFSKLQNNKKNSDVSTSAYMSKTPREHLRNTSRCDFQNYLIEKTSSAECQLDTIFSERGQHDISSQQKNNKKIILNQDSQKQDSLMDIQEYSQKEYRSRIKSLNDN